jgi:serine/threonine protein kinase
VPAPGLPRAAPGAPPATLPTRPRARTRRRRRRRAQEDIIHEAQTMKSYSHPNVLSLYASFVAGEDLFMVTPFCSGGSVLHIMKYGHPEVRRLERGAAAALPRLHHAIHLCSGPAQVSV